MTFHDFIRKSLTPLLWLNCLGMLVAGVWLVYLGHWSAVWVPLIFLGASPILFPLLLLPAGLFAELMNKANGKGESRKASLMMVGSMLYLVTALSFYAMETFWMVQDTLKDGTTMAPAMIWGICAAIAPWALFATRDRANTFFTSLLLMMQVAGIVVAFLARPLHLDFSQAFFMYWAVMAFLTMLQTVHDAKNAG